MEKSSPSPQPSLIKGEGEGTENSQDSSKMNEISTVSARAGMVGSFTFISRFFGLARDSFIAYLLGTKQAADAFYVAFRIPNLLRRLLAEGNLTISFVPVFTEVNQKNPEEAKRVASATTTLLFLILLFITVLGVVFSATFVQLIAHGFSENPEKFALAASLTRITFPYILLVSLAALAMGILNSLKIFSAPAAAPIFMNLGIIAGGFLLGRSYHNPSYGLAWGVLLGGLLQIAVQIPALLRVGYFPKISFDFSNAYVRRIFKLMLPALYGSAVNQLNLVVITYFASRLEGAVSYLWYADRVMEFPLGVFAVSFATVILPQLSQHAANKNLTQFKETYVSGLRMIWFVNIPAMVGLIALAQLIIAVLFQHGSFDAVSTQKTAWALQCFAIGLPFISGTRITASAFYSLFDSKSPVMAANLAVVVNLVVGLTLFQFFGHVGLAIGVSCGSLFNFLMHLYDFQKKHIRLNFLELFPFVVKTLLAALGMGLLLYLLQHFLGIYFWDKKGMKVLFLLILVASGAFAYAGFAWVLGVEELKTVLGLVRRKLKF